MNSPHRRTGFGLHDLSRQVARRRRRAIEETENPAAPVHLAEIIPFPVPYRPSSHLTAPPSAALAEVIPFPRAGDDRPGDPWPTPPARQRRPLAA